jgi:hypothetical protein
MAGRKGGRQRGRCGAFNSSAVGPGAHAWLREVDSKSHQFLEEELNLV